jgi:hypothetical protein
VIAELLKMKWWDWDIEDISKRIDALMKGDLESLRIVRSNGA